MTIDIQKFKEALTKEKEGLEAQLQTIGRKNPDNQEDWEATKKGVEVDAADEGEVAEGIEQYETNNSILDQLEIQLNEVKSALQKIEDGTFGKCEVCGNDIEEDRLLANRAAKTCIAHMN